MSRPESEGRRGPVPAPPPIPRCGHIRAALLREGFQRPFFKPETRNQKPETRNQKPETRKFTFLFLVFGFWFLVYRKTRRTPELPRATESTFPAGSEAFRVRGLPSESTRASIR